MLTKSKPGDTLIYIPDLFAEVVSKVSVATGFDVQYDYGHYEEVQSKLAAKNSGMTDAQQVKYPLLWFVMDFPERRGNYVEVYAEIQAHFMICVTTVKSYSMKERRDAVFLPILYPIYDSFLTEVARDFRHFTVITKDLATHVKIDRPYYQGGVNKAGEPLFDDYLDAIEIKDFKLQIKPKTCW